MKKFAVATIGIEPNDLTTLKSMLNIVTGATGGWDLIEQPEQSHLTFVCGLPPEQLASMIEKLGAITLLVYCCRPGETPPDGFLTIRRPLRPTDMSRLLDEANKRFAAGEYQSVNKAHKDDDSSEHSGVTIGGYRFE